MKKIESLEWRLNYMPNTGNVNNNYPYPVLGNYDDFKTSNNFSIRVRYGARNGHFEFACSITFNSFRTDCEKLIQDRAIQLSILVFNAQTFYRQFYTGFEKEIRFCIPQDIIRGKLNITAYMTSTEPIIGYSPSGQNNIYYGNNSFDIDAGSVLAVSNTIETFIEPYFKKQNKDEAKHIIKFVKSKTLTKTFEVRNWGEDQLIVEMPKVLYKIWSTNITEQTKYIHHCAIYLPILTDAVTKMEYEDSKEQYGDLKWFFVLDKLMKDAELPEDMDASIKAQMLMQGPFKPFEREIKSIMEIIIGDDE